MKIKYHKIYKSFPNVAQHAWSYSTLIEYYCVRWSIVFRHWHVLLDTSLTPSLLIEVPVLSQESDQSSICVLGVSKLPISTIYLLNFRTVQTVWSFFVFHFIVSCEKTIMMMYRLLLLTAELKLQSLEIERCGRSTVIKIIKMKYHRIDFKWRLVSTSFKIHLEIISPLDLVHHLHDFFVITILFHSGVHFFMFQLKAFIKQNHTVYI